MTSFSESGAFWVQKREILENILTKCLASPQNIPLLQEMNQFAKELAEEGKKQDIHVITKVATLLSEVITSLENPPGRVFVAHQVAALAEGVALFGEVVSILLAGNVPQLETMTSNIRLKELLQAFESNDDHPGRGTIAVVDNDSFFHKLIREVLRPSGYALHSYMSSAEALKGVLENPPDLILLDIGLGQEDGRDLFRILRREPSLDLIPILFLTAHAEPEQVIFGFAMGADDYISKTVGAEELVARVEARLERARVTSRVALLDPLTGIGNRRHLQMYLRGEMARVHREEIVISLAILDLDHFKSINDRFGHPIGDEVLVICASILQKGIRPYDTVARYGGEEFALILPNAQIETASKVVDRLRHSFSAKIREVLPGLPAVDFSAGVASAPQDGKESEKILSIADQRLYQAKEQGRGRVIGIG